MPATRCFATSAAADPSRVWAVLTCPEARYLHGLALKSEWTAGAAVRIDAEPGALRGTVLAAVPRERLSFLFEDPSGTSVHVTWEIRTCPTAPDSTVVRLWIDDSEGASVEEMEDTWLPVLARVADAARTAPAG